MTETFWRNFRSPPKSCYSRLNIVLKAKALNDMSEGERLPCLLPVSSFFFHVSQITFGRSLLHVATFFENLN